MAAGRAGLVNAAGRAAIAVGFVAGIASFIYGLKSGDRWWWVWILASVALLAAVVPPILRASSEVVQRYQNYPFAVATRQEAEAKAERLSAIVARNPDVVRDARRQGISEGIERVRAWMLSGVEITPQHLDFAGGVVRITATATATPDEVAVGSRYVLEHMGSGTAIAILRVASVASSVILEPTDYVDLDAWGRLEDRAISGDVVPPGLGLRRCALADYDKFESS